MDSTIFVDATDSTNALIRRMLEDGSELPDGFAVVAAQQSAGRGLAGNTWFGGKDRNLLVSFLFRPQCSAVRQFAFNQCFTLAVRKFVARYVSDVKIKWPNDIYVDGKKIAGILIEHSIMDGQINYSIAGVGINVNQTTFPVDIPNPISIQLIANQIFNLKKLTEELIVCCRNSHCSSALDYSAINKEYFKYLYLYNEYAEYEFKEGMKKAKICGIDSYGRLLLKEEGGTEHCCGMKEVKLCVK